MSAELAPASKVMFVTPYFAPKIGGLENYALRLAQNLRTCGFDVVVVTTNHEGKGRREELVEGLRVIRLPITRVISNTPINPLWYFQLKKIIRTEQPDLINAHAPVPGLADMAIRAAGKIPTVLTYHAATLRKAGSPAMRTLTRVVEFAQRRTFRRADRLVAVSDYVKQSLPQQVQTKTEVVHNAVDLAEIPTQPVKHRNKRLVFVGSLDRTHAWKGLDEIMLAIQLLKKKQPKVELHVLGDGDARHTYEAKAEELGIAQHVVFHGFVQGAEKYQLIRSSAALIAYPTTANDAFPTVFPEAWACKTPIIAANIGALGSLINDGQDGILVPPHKPRSLANTTAKALDSPRTLRKLAEAGYKRVSESLTWATVADQTAELFRRTSGRPIAYVANFAIDNSLAPSIHVHEICQNLQGLGRDVTLFAPALKDQGAPFAFRRVAMPRFVRPLSPLTYQFKLLWALGRHVRRNPRTILYTRQEAFMFAPTVISKLLHVPLFIEANGAIEEETLADARLPLRGLWKRTRLFAAIEGAAYRQATHIFTVTNNLKKRLKNKYGITAKQVTVVENGVNTTLLRPMDVTRPAGELRIGFVGHLTPWEGMAYAVTAMQKVVAKLPNAKLVLAGDGEQLAELKQLAATLGLEKNVEFLGRIDHDDIPAFLNSCDVCLAYYTRERAGLNSPFKVYEYLACGKPVVVSDIAGLSDHFSGAVVPAKAEDSADLAKTLVALLKSDERRATLGERGLTYIRAGHSWQAVASAINQHLLSAVRVRRALRSRTQRMRSHALLGTLIGIAAASLLTQFVLQDTPLAIALHVANFGLVFGALIAAQLKKMRALRSLEWLALSVGLGLAGLLGLGWLLNGAGLLFHWHTLRSGPVVGTVYAAEGLLALRAWFRRHKQPATPAAERVHFSWRTWVPLAFPLAAAFGAERLNNGAGGALAIGTLAATLGWQTYLLASRRKLNSSEIAATLWGSSAALLLSVAMRSNHLIGYDIHQEYQVFSTTLANGIWQPNAVHNTYNACLSITVLPTMLVQLLHIPAQYIFKLAMQLTVSIVPLLVYMLTRAYFKLSKKMALVAALFFMLQLQYVIQFPALVRQEVAFVFFALLFVTAAIDALSKRLRLLLIAAFGMAMVVSHYSTSIVGLSLLAAAAMLQYVAPMLWKRLKARSVHDQAGLGLAMRPALLVFLMLFGFVWYAQMSNATSTIMRTVENSAKHIGSISQVLHNNTRSTFVTNTFSLHTSANDAFSIEKLEKQNLVPRAYSQHIYTQYPVTAVAQHKATATTTPGKLTLVASKLGVPALVKLAFVAGLVTIAVLAWRGRMAMELGTIAFAAAGMLLVLTVVPFVSDKYNLDRLYQQLIVVLAAAPVIGVQTLLRRKRQAWVLPVVGALILAYGASTTGLVNQLAFGAGDINLSNNNETYSRYYANDSDVSALGWLQATNTTTTPTPVNFDRYTTLDAYAYSTLSSRAIIPSVLPGRVEPGFYVYKSSINAAEGAAYNRYNGTAARFAYPTSFLDNTKNTIYASGGTAIYK